MTTAATSNTDLTECEQVLKGGGNAKGWSLEIYNDIYANPSVCGEFFRCGACGINGRTQGVINMRHTYAVGSWNYHCKTYVHSSAVVNIEADKEDASLKNKKQKPMTNFFAAAKKKGREAAVVESATSSNTVALTKKKPSGCAGVWN